jgi:hypothetical protein
VDGSEVGGAIGEGFGRAVSGAFVIGADDGEVVTSTGDSVTAVGASVAIVGADDGDVVTSTGDSVAAVGASVAIVGDGAIGALVGALDGLSVGEETGSSEGDEAGVDVGEAIEGDAVTSGQTALFGGPSSVFSKREDGEINGHVNIMRQFVPKHRLTNTAHPSCCPAETLATTEQLLSYSTASKFVNC